MRSATPNVVDDCPHEAAVVGIDARPRGARLAQGIKPLAPKGRPLDLLLPGKGWESQTAAGRDISAGHAGLSGSENSGARKKHSGKAIRIRAP
jgi:hypothetical protein